MENIFLPTTIEFSATDRSNVGKVVITPCHQGYGTTIGNALRRVLLSSLPGAAVESVKISGVQHEFSGPAGVQEDVIEMILNLKQMAVKSFSEAPVSLSLAKKGKGEVKAGDFEKNADVEIANQDLHIATLTSDKANLEMEITIGKGRGYVMAAEKDIKNWDLGTVAIDSLYTPIRDVGYSVEPMRVGDITDFEKLTLTIETNGTISPKEAVMQSVNILLDYLRLISETAGANEVEEGVETGETEESKEIEGEESLAEEEGEDKEKGQKKEVKKKSVKKAKKKKSE